MGAVICQGKEDATSEVSPLFSGIQDAFIFQGKVVAISVVSHLSLEILLFLEKVDAVFSLEKEGVTFEESPSFDLCLAWEMEIVASAW